MTVRVTVVVATFNSGSMINPLIDSLDHQSLSPDEFEVVFVDDGSTDGTDERLRGVAAARPNVRTTQIPNSGWPGRPRNIGLDMARGEYVFFADHDDFFGDQALERMYDYAKANSSDVLVAREQRVGRQPAGAALFAKNRPRADLTWSPLVGVLTPHKLFRRAFLLDHGVRFPEGKRRLEDHAFVLTAYFAADVISVLADYPCYFWVFNEGTTNYSGGMDPTTYYPYVVEALDIVEANTEPGPHREALLAHWYRAKVLAFMERSASRIAPARREALFQITGELSRTRFAASDPYLTPARRVLSALLRAGDGAHIVALSEAMRGLTAGPVVRSAHWRDGVLYVEVEAALSYANGEAVRFHRRDAAILWIPPVDIGSHVADAALDMTSVLAEVNMSAFVQHMERGVAWTLGGESRRSITPGADGTLVLTLTHTVIVDVRSGEGNGPLEPGRWRLRVMVRGLGLDTTDPLRAPAPAVGHALVDGRPVVPYVTKNGNLSLAVAVPRVPLVTGADSRPDLVHVQREASGLRLVIELPQLHVSGDGARSCAVHIGALSVPALLVANGEEGPARLESQLRAVPGRHRLSLDLGGTDTPLNLDLVVDRQGRARVEKSRRPSPLRGRARAAPLRAIARRVPGVRRKR
jgi:poly(ribitol-phosphate) beta-N-acetylglucosaminyltransferase